VDGQREFADAGGLSDVVKTVFGAARRIVTVERLPNGSKKGVYRLVLDDATSALVYAWSESEDYWHGLLPDGAEDRASPFSHASGLDLFEAAVARLESVGVRCPRLLSADRSRQLYPAEIAVVEYVPGGTLEALLERDPGAANPIMARLAESVTAMHAHQATQSGKVAFVDGGGVCPGTSCPQVVLDRALAEVAEIASRDLLADTAHTRLLEKLNTLAAQVQPRAQLGLIHGELGPDHVLVDRHGDPVLIDIEGLMYFDVEWEHVFMRMRFGKHYPHLRRDTLDEQRLRFYQLAMHLDLVAGPLRIAESDHPERAWFREIAADHLQRALAYPS
jgi:Phosphotransferase enzyme family